MCTREASTGSREREKEKEKGRERQTEAYFLTDPIT